VERLKGMLVLHVLSLHKLQHVTRLRIKSTCVFVTTRESILNKLDLNV
jgi:hypothetical protein